MRGRCAVKTTTNDTARLPKNRPPTHPGEILLEEFLNPAGMSQAEAARRLDIPTNRINELVKGKRGMTAGTALKLAALFDTTPQFWMNLQTNLELWQAMHKPATVAVTPYRHVPA
jgi:addiction module HigA family antidote